MTRCNLGNLGGSPYYNNTLLSLETCLPRLELHTINNPKSKPISILCCLGEGADFQQHCRPCHHCCYLRLSRCSWPRHCSNGHQHCALILDLAIFVLLRETTDACSWLVLAITTGQLHSNHVSSCWCQTTFMWRHQCLLMAVYNHGAYRWRYK